MRRGSSADLPTLEEELALLDRGYQLIAGVDEVGRGSWAGPIVAAAVVLPLHDPGAVDELQGVRDSKQLTAADRLDALERIISCGARIGLGWASHHAVDRDGLSRANCRAMHRAALALQPRPDALLLDHFRLPECDFPQVAITRGDARCLSIAAASIVAKVLRDHWMQRCEARFPGYSFGSNKGYGTSAHRRALLAHGPTSLHRRSFVPIAELLS